MQNKLQSYESYWQPYIWGHSSLQPVSNPLLLLLPCCSPPPHPTVTHPVTFHFQAMNHTGSYIFRVTLPYNQSLTPYSSFSLATPSPPLFVTHPVTFHFQAINHTGSYTFRVIVLCYQSLSHFPLSSVKRF